MKIYRFKESSNIKVAEDIVACIGYFDGLHLGHQALIEKVKEIAIKKDTKRALITFYPDPKDIITKKRHRHIQSFDDRLKIAQAMGIEIAIVFEFTEHLCLTSAEDFFEKILGKLPLKGLVSGFDFHFGHKGKGDVETLKKLAKDRFEVDIVPEVLYEGEKISSTRVRLAIERGDIKLARALLGYDYFDRGLVVHGKRNGHRLGFPTANLRLDEEILIPKNGVYIGYAVYDEKSYKAMINIGNNPTIASNNGLTYEVHILDFDKDIYDSELIIYLNERIRDDKRFSSLEDLKKQLENDRKRAEEQDARNDFIL